MTSGAKYVLWGLVILFAILPWPIKGRETGNTKEDKTAADQNKKEKKKKPKNKKTDPDTVGDPDRGVGTGVNFYSLEKEIMLGKQLAQELEKSAKIIEDPIIAEYVNRIGQNLVRNSDAKVPFTIKVLDTEEPNALSLPGGFFYVNSGLVLLAESESELAGAMAHEIAHIAARHGTRQATRGEIVNYATLPTIFWGGWIGYGVRQGLGVAVPLAFLKYSRGFENEADDLGAQYMHKAGYDPNGLIEMFERLEKLNKKKLSKVAQIFMNHAPTGERAQKVQKIIDDFPPREQYAVNTSEFMNVKARLVSMYNRPKRPTGKDAETGRPTLRKGAPSGKVEPGEDKKKDDKEDEDDRPTLKRRP